jgi:hypothetical protein
MEECGLRPQPKSNMSAVSFTYSCFQKRQFEQLDTIKLYCSCKDWDFYKTTEEGNTGLYFVRSNERTIRLFTDLNDLAPKYVYHCSLHVVLISRLMAHRLPCVLGSPI